MPTQNRKHRGMRTQLVVANYLRDHGFPFAESTGSSRSGSDVTGTPGLAIEVKARANFNPQEWVRQAARNPGLPFVCFRPNMMGETTTEQWPCIVRLADLVTLLRLAGYGSPIENARPPLADQLTLIDVDNSRELLP